MRVPPGNIVQAAIAAVTGVAHSDGMSPLIWLWYDSAAPRCALCLDAVQPSANALYAHTMADVDRMPPEVKSALMLGATDLSPWSEALRHVFRPT